MNARTNKLCLDRSTGFESVFSIHVYDYPRNQSTNRKRVAGLLISFHSLGSAVVIDAVLRRATGIFRSETLQSNIVIGILLRTQPIEFLSLTNQLLRSDSQHI